VVPPAIHGACRGGTGRSDNALPAARLRPAAATRAFPDHHRFSIKEARTLLDEATRKGLLLLTTEKDMARIKADAALSDLALPAHVLPVTLRVQESEEFGKLVLGVCRRAGASP